MKDIIQQAVSEVFNVDALEEAIADQVAEMIDYREIARVLAQRASLRELVQDAALAMAEDLL